MNVRVPMYVLFTLIDRIQTMYVRYRGLLDKRGKKIKLPRKTKGKVKRIYVVLANNTVY